MPFPQSTSAHERFLDIELIGQGAFGNVYRAFDQRLRRTIAVKEIQANLPPEIYYAARARFEHEARIVAQLNSPHIVVVYDYKEDTQQGEEYLYLEYVPYGTLASALREQQPLTERVAALIARDIVRAIAAHWSIEVVHRDIKPSNVLLLRDSEGNITGAKLTDYGIAQDQRATQRTQIGQRQPGTPSYMSPEQASSQRALTAASDMYNVGLLLWEMLTGTPHYKQQFEPRTTTTIKASPRMLRIIQQALEQSLERRYKQPAKMIEDLDAVLAAQSAAGARQRASQPVSKRRKLIGAMFAGGLLLTVLGIGGVLAAMNDRENPIPPQASTTTVAAKSTIVAVLPSATATTTRTPTLAPTSTATLTPAPTIDSTATAASFQTATAQAQAQQSATALAQQATELAQAQQATALAQQATASAQAQQATALAQQPPPPPTEIPIPPLRAFPVSIESVANDNISAILPQFPKGNKQLADVLFSIPEQNNKASTQCSTRQNWPVSFNVAVNNIQRPEALYLLIGAGYTVDRTSERIGVVQVNFVDGRSLYYDLILGRNIREWRVDVPKTVRTASSTDLVEVYRGVSSSGDTGVLDMLKLYIPDDHKTGMVRSITVHDVSQEVGGSSDPCMFVAGITILARN